MSDVLQILGNLRRSAHDVLVDPVWSPSSVDPPGDPLPYIDLPRVLHERFAARFFTDAAVPQGAPATLVKAARAVDAMLWPLLAKTHPLEHLLVIRNVVGVESGIYQAGPDEEMIRRFDLPEVAQVEEMVLQPEFALAPMLFLTVGSLERALEWAGDHGHRVMLERSGAASEAAWLAAVDLGLGGSIFAGFLPSALRQLAGIDGFRQTQLLALAIGEPLAGAQPSTSLGISA